MIRNNNFIEIKNYTILNKDVFIQKDHISYHFQLPEKINDININSFASKIIAIKLKVKETDLITSFEYEFLDLFNIKLRLILAINFLMISLKTIGYIFSMVFIIIIKHYMLLIFRLLK